MKKIAIIKLGALGDVLRTLPLAKALKKKFPDSEITWITKNNVSELVRKDPAVSLVKEIPYHEKVEFDTLYNFDIDSEATELASNIPAKEKFGFTSDSGYPVALNQGAEYYLNTLFDDELKKSNRKTYQEMMFKAAELPFEKEQYNIYLSPEEESLGKKFVEQNNMQCKSIVGIHIGSSQRWPSKSWHDENIKEFIKKVKKSGSEVILFAGPTELEKQRSLIHELKVEGISVSSNNPENSLGEFASLLNVCDSVVCADSLALHVALGLGKKTSGLFFCTSPHEVESYNLLTKLTSPQLENFFPERMDEYDEGLTKSISADEVFKSLDRN